MIGKKINQLATELAPVSTDLTIIGDPISGVSKKITLAQLGAIFSGAVSFYANLASFPVTGDINVIYCAKDTQKLYLWSGSAYVEVFPSQALLNTYQLRSEKGVSNGYASLDSGGKVPISQLPSSIMEYKGTWNAATNTPTLANGTGDTGDVYICNVAGTVNFGAGPLTFAVGDYVIYSGTIWQRSSGAVGTVTSVAVSRSGDALAITGSPVTTSGTINVGFAGNSTQYINGAGNLVTFPGVINEAQNLITEVYNKTGATLTKGTIVYINGGQGNLPTITKALATGDSTSAQTYGIVRNDITNNNNGYVVVAGRISDLDTQAYTEGTQLYLSPTTAGTFTSTKPYAPQHLVYVGIVVRAHPTQGVIEVKIQNGYELDELHNVAAQSPSNGDILQYVSSTSLWTKVAGTTSNIAEGSNLYYTDARSRAALSFTAGSGAYNSTTGVITIPTNTNQLTNGANYITLGSLSASSPLSYNNGTGAFSISQANTSTNGFLSSTDWNTFNGKQAALNGTGFVKASGTSITYDNSTYVTTDTFQTISASKTFSVGLSLASAGGTNQITSFVNTNSIHSGSTATNVLGFNNSNNIYFGKGLNNGGVITFNNAAVRFYALPDADGTIALVGGSGVGTVTSVGLSSATSGVTIGSTPITTSGTITLAIATASGSQQGLLSSTDWTTFNNKQSALTNPVTGSGTTNYLPKFTGASTIGNSNVQDNGTTVQIGSASTTSVGLTIRNGSGASRSAYVTLIGTNGSSNDTTWYSGVNVFATDASYEIKNAAGNGLLLNASGNLGLGVTPSAWSTFKAFELPNIGFIASAGEYIQMIANGVYNGTNYTYKTSNVATMYAQAVGQHQWFSAPSGTAGNTFTFTQAMTLNASGNLSLGNTNDTYKLDVTGTGRFSGNLRVQNVSSGRYFDFVTDSSASYLDVSHSLNVRVNGASSLLTALTIASTGAATFSSSVEIGQAATVRGFTGNSGAGMFLNYGSAGAGIGSIFTYNYGTSTYGPTILDGSYVAFYNSGSERMRVTGGNVGIGSTAPTNTSGYATLTVGGATSTLGQITWNSGTTAIGYAYNDGTNMYIGSNAALIFATTSGATERMRITSGGAVCINTTSAFTDTLLSLSFAGNLVNAFSMRNTNTSNSGNYIVFQNSSGGLAGYIQQSSATTVLYSVTSDYRLKEDLKDYNGLELISKIKTYDYRWKEDKKRMYGVMAHELQQVISYAVSGEKDGLITQGVDYSKIVPVLIKAIQELNDKIK